jgi:hypothetical protein
MDAERIFMALDFDRDSKGRIKGTWTNTVEAVRLAVGGLWFYKTGFDVVFVDDHGTGRWGRIAGDTDYTKVMLALEGIGFRNPRKTMVKQAVQLVAEENRWKPNPWGRRRL